LPLFLAITLIISEEEKPVPENGSSKDAKSKPRESYEFWLFRKCGYYTEIPSGRFWSLPKTEVPTANCAKLRS
jgi:hypothetical protein